MGRSDWIREQRSDTEARYSTIWAPGYGIDWGITIDPTHREFMRRFLALLPQPGALLDAACGAGRFAPLLLDAGHTVLGIDQSAGMLARAQILVPGMQVQQIGLQELAFEDAFDGAICMDALEHVSPEDWPLALFNVHRALRSSSPFYFTVEIASEVEVRQAFGNAHAAGLPAVLGESWYEGVYHYYPSLAQVRAWLDEVGFDVVDEGEAGDYHHFIARRS